MSYRQQELGDLQRQCLFCFGSWASLDSPPVGEKSETPGGIRDAETLPFGCKLRDVAFLLELQVQEYAPDWGTSLIPAWVETNLYLRLLWKTSLQAQIPLVTPTALKNTRAPAFSMRRFGQSSDCTSVETGLQDYTIWHRLISSPLTMYFPLCSQSFVFCCQDITSLLTASKPWRGKVWLTTALWRPFALPTPRGLYWEIQNLSTLQRYLAKAFSFHNTKIDWNMA